MTRKLSVSLQTNGNYWLASYRDEFGALRRVSLGNRTKVKRADALRRCHEIADGLAKVGKPMTMAEWDERYFDLRTDLGPATTRRHKVAMRRMREFFGENARTDRITEAQANSFVAHLRTIKKPNGQPLAKFTIWGIVGVCHEVFGWAIRDRRAEKNPFEHARVPMPKVRKAWPYVPVEKVEELIDASPNTSWGLLWALARMAGLRRGEALRLRWADVDLSKRLLYVWPPKGEATTKADARAVPIVPRLEALLVGAHEQAPAGRELVCWQIDPENMGDQLQKTMKAVGAAWEKPLHTLRKSLVTDWKNIAPSPAVAEWLGHNEDVADRHYYATLPEITALVTGATRTNGAKSCPAPSPEHSKRP